MKHPAIPGQPVAVGLVVRLYYFKAYLHQTNKQNHLKKPSKIWCSSCNKLMLFVQA